MFKKNISKNKNGFTLIELLIVIVIIGILAGVLIAVIDPMQQQNRAKDANVISTLNKIGLVTQGHVSAYGKAPEKQQFIANLQNSIDNNCNMIGGSANSCTFTVQGNELPALCGAQGWNGVGTSQCFYRYVYGSLLGGSDGTFRMYAKSYGLVDKMFVYDNRVGYLLKCNLSGVDDNTSPAQLQDPQNCER